MNIPLSTKNICLTLKIHMVQITSLAPMISSSTLNEHEINWNHDSNNINLIADIQHSIETRISNQAIASMAL
jgi:hypothetical protein